MEGKRQSFEINQQCFINKVMKKDIGELKERILKKAEAEVKQMVTHAKKARERILERAKEDSEEIQENARKKALEIFQLEERKIEAERTIQKRREELKIRGKIFDFMIRDLEDRIYEMLKKGELNSWIREEIKEIILLEGEKMTLVTKDKDKKLFKKLIKGIKGIQIKTTEMEPGFLLRGVKSEYDFRFHLLAKNLLDRNRKTVFSMIRLDNG